jgi:hypothetical protein
MGRILLKMSFLHNEQRTQSSVLSMHAILTILQKNILRYGTSNDKFVCEDFDWDVNRIYSDCA